jgi:hypothetical protein
MQRPARTMEDVIAQLTIGAGFVDQLIDETPRDDTFLYSRVVDLRRILRSVIPFVVKGSNGNFDLGATRATTFMDYCDRLTASRDMPA